MDIHKLYRATVEASERLEEMGLKPGMVLFTYDYDQVHRPEEVQIRVAGGKDGFSLFDRGAEGREELVTEFLERNEDTRLERTKGQFETRPRMIVRWTTEEGVEVKLDFDYGVCEKVQVGTKVEEQYDPEALDAVPKVEVEVPVYEYMCPDPLRA